MKKCFFFETELLGRKYELKEWSLTNGIISNQNNS